MTRYEAVYKGDDYETNNSGNGLWKNGKQVFGTCDFHAKSDKQLYGKVAKIFKN